MGSLSRQIRRNDVKRYAQMNRSSPSRLVHDVWERRRAKPQKKDDEPIVSPEELDLDGKVSD